MSDEFEPDQDVEPSEDQEQAAGEDKRHLKLQKENESLRRRLRTFEAAEKYGKDVAELIPEELPITKWDEFAEKLKVKFSAVQFPTPTEATEEAPEEPTPEERQLAAVTKQGPSGAGPSPGIYSAEEAIRVYSENPEQYRRLREAGLVKLEKLPGSDKE